MTRKLENQFVCQFSIGPYEDFILLEDLQELKYIEYAGNVLPTIELQFILRNKDVVNYFNEGNILNVSLGIYEKTDEHHSFYVVTDHKINLILANTPHLKVDNRHIIDYFTYC